MILNSQELVSEVLRFVSSKLILFTTEDKISYDVLRKWSYDEKQLHPLHFW